MVPPAQLPGLIHALGLIWSRDRISLSFTCHWHASHCTVRRCRAHRQPPASACTTAPTDAIHLIGPFDAILVLCANASHFLSEKPCTKSHSATTAALTAAARDCAVLIIYIHIHSRIRIRSTLDTQHPNSSTLGLRSHAVAWAFGTPWSSCLLLSLLCSALLFSSHLRLASSLTSACKAATTAISTMSTITIRL